MEKLESQTGEGYKGDLGLSDLDINNFMTRNGFPVGSKYLGCIAADEIHLLKTDKKRYCFIINTDPRGKPGSHWCAVFIDLRDHGSHSVEFYDPLADQIPKEWFEKI